ncbi:hypothetical protein ACIPPQ_14605 [Sphingopyxis sp. LARHCG72]
MSGAQKLTYATNRPIGYDGLNDNERQVLALWDAYVPVNQIADRTKLSRGFIEQVVSEFSVTAHEPWKGDARQGSTALLAALRHHHPAHCGAAS